LAASDRSGSQKSGPCARRARGGCVLSLFVRAIRERLRTDLKYDPRRAELRREASTTVKPRLLQAATPSSRSMCIIAAVATIPGREKMLARALESVVLNQSLPADVIFVSTVEKLVREIHVAGRAKNLNKTTLSHSTRAKKLPKLPNDGKPRKVGQK